MSIHTALTLSVDLPVLMALAFTLQENNIAAMVYYTAIKCTWLYIYRER